MNGSDFYKYVNLAPNNEKEGEISGSDVLSNIFNWHPELSPKLIVNSVNGYIRNNISFNVPQNRTVNANYLYTNGDN